MKRTFLFFFSIFCGQLSFSQEKVINAIDTVNVAPNIAKAIAKSSSKFPINTQLSIALIDGENTKYVGIIRKDDRLVSIENSRAIFEIGSNTKVFTSLLLSHEIQKGNLQLTDKLVSVLPSSIETSPEKTQEISLQMLANHSSGLPRLPENIFPLVAKNMENPYKEYTPALLRAYLKDQIRLENDPGNVSAYSNLGAGLLGYVLTQTTKSSYEELLQKTILQPLGMTHTTTELSKVPTSKLVLGLKADGTTAANWDFTNALVGAGGMKSNVVDLEKFVRKNFEDDTIYNLPQQPTIKVNGQVQVGLGWHLISKNQQTFLFHNGGTGGYLSCMIVDKANQKAVILLSNVSAFNPQGPNIDKLCFTLMELL
jgi:CubicO group peptidase (beta-lactamase class C family)